MDEELLARRQKDMGGFVERYDDRLEKMLGKHIDSLAPAWQGLTKTMTGRLKDLYAEIGATEDPKKLKALKNKAKRMEALASQLANDLKTMETKLQPYYTGALTNIYEDSYYMHAYGLEQAAGVAVRLPILTPMNVLGVIANPWLPDAATYSDRIRANTAFLAQKMRGVVANAVARGQGINEAARAISDAAGEGYFNSVRLMRTELNRASSLGSSYLYMQNADILDGKRWNATLDSKTAPKDAANDGHIFDLDYDTPENVATAGKRIPNHPNCRCKYSPVLSATGVSDKERIARTGDGPDNWGTRTFVKAKDYREYAKKAGLPDLDERLAKDNLKSYLRPGETLDALDKRVVRWKAPSGGTITVPKPFWEAAQTAAAEFIPAAIQGFTPAKTLEEAQSYALANFADEVDFSKYTLETANTINGELYQLFEKYDVPKFTKLNRTTPHGAAGFFQGATDPNINVRRGRMGISAAFNRKETADALIEDFKDRGKGLTKTFYSQDDPLKHTVVHEFGHVLFSNKGSKAEMLAEIRKLKAAYSKEVNALLKPTTSQSFNQARLGASAEDFAKLKKIYISDYAATETDEWVAEAFADARLSDTPSPYSVKLMEIIDKYVPLKANAAKKATSWADAVKERIAKGVKTETDVREVGSLVRQRVNTFHDGLRAERASLQQKTDDIIAKLNATDPKDYDGPAYAKLNEDLKVVRDKYYEVTDKLVVDKADFMRDVIRDIRPVGPKDANDLQEFISGSSVDVKTSVNMVRDYIPTDWVQASNARPLKAKKSKRGYYREAPFKSEADLNAKGYTMDQLRAAKKMEYMEDIISLSGEVGNSMDRCTFHEMGHRLEDMIPGIKKLEKEFYARRTAGERLEWLGPGYKTSETTRKDKFLSAYMGKDYGNKEDSFYELLSMGLESAYKGSYDLVKDDDYADFIYGIMAAL